MSFPASFNLTQQGQVLEALFKSTASSVAPALLLESFIFGILCACVPIGSYLLWIKPHSFPRIPFISILWVLFTMMITHWALSFRQLEWTFSGRAMEVSLTQHALLFYGYRDGEHVVEAYESYASAWLLLLPLVTETVLFGFASFLFAVTAYTYFWSTLSQYRSGSTLIIPAMATIMYTLSLVHWAISIRPFTLFADHASLMATISDSLINDNLFNDNPESRLEVALLVLLSVNAVMSDSIVIWRMCVVWDRARSVIAFGSALLVATLGLNLANIIVTARARLTLHGTQIAENDQDTEIITIYGGNYLGLAAAFVSLASNACATVLVGLKVWLHRRQLSKHVRSDSSRTLAERVMELLVDSGVAYTSIWLLYCVSFFRTITTHPVLGQDPSVGPSVTASGHLDAAMAQITSIYPLIIFMLVALDKIQHSRGPRILHNKEWPDDRGAAVPFTFEIDVDRNMTLGPTSAHPMLALSGANRSPSLDDKAV
ncbi:hypothetical protein PENSPDRAFT_688549 [Peniophora sp. CONT]|nr:hypothetical protein PENSPDRAFT_688549 [Peniophora sp. CONT]